jgi:Rhamnogalacturonan lyase family 11, C-terminal domain/Rhamnogalacturonan I lyases beta-sheet domain/Secretion system C-terminal sorting domain
VVSGGKPEYLQPEDKMTQVQHIISIIGMMLIFAGPGKGQTYQLENLDRGLIAVMAPNGGVYLGWRLLAGDPDSIKFNVYRGTTKINDEPLFASTNIIDSTGTVSDLYSVAPVIDGVEQTASAEVTPWAQNYKTILLQRPAGGQTPDGVAYNYSPNDASAADLDGDGEYELVLKWDPSNSKDNSQSGYTGNVYLDGLEMDGTLLWRIDLGKNIRAGAHYSPFMVYDLDGDGHAEVACKTAEGSKDGLGNFIANDSTKFSGAFPAVNNDADHRNGAGYILLGYEFLTIFNGQTGEEMMTTYYYPPRNNNINSPDVSAWGDNYGNRADRFLACIAYLDGERPSLVMTRGYYTRCVLAAWDWRDGELTQRWVFDSDDGTPGNSAYRGKGNHNLSVGDVDGDGRDEILYGAATIDDDGTGLYSGAATGSNHGDAMHFSDMDPSRPGLEVFKANGDVASPVGIQMRDAATGATIWAVASTGADGAQRAAAFDIDPTSSGYEAWGGGDPNLDGRIFSATGRELARNANLSINFGIWWDGDLLRELLNGTTISKWDWTTNSTHTLLSPGGLSSNNGSKSTPTLSADLIGDWREEVIWRASDNSSLRLYTTTDTTRYRLTTLMHDRQYRLAVAWQNVAYNQPPHPGYYIGADMFSADSLRPPSRPLHVQTLAWEDTVRIEWDANTDFDLAGYKLYRGKSEDSLMLLIDTGTATSYLDTEVTNDSTYYYAVTAYDFDGNQSAYSDIVPATPTIRPAVPTGFSYRFDANSILLIWDSQDFENIATVNIYRSATEGMPLDLIATQDKSLNTYLDANRTLRATYYYRLSVTDTNGVESFPTDVLSIATWISFTMQSEGAALSGTVLVETEHAGFHGTAYTNFDASNSAVEFTHMPGFGGGERILVFRYALGSTDRTGALIINGNASSLTMRGTGAWTNYVLDSVGVTLNEGYDNTIRFAATGGDFGNLDEITILPMAITSVEGKDGEGNIPTDFQLYQNYPNPFNPQTTISFALPQAAHVSINIYDIKGRLVSTLLNKKYQAGIHEIQFDGKNLASGVYSVQTKMVSSDNQSGVHLFTKKIILLK